MRAIVLLLLGLLLMTAPALAQQEKRVALIIGNGAYRTITPLKNPTNDARDLSASLKRLGFAVIEALDASKQDMERKLSEFARAANGADAALVFFSGHALQLGGKNYLIPVDAQIDTELSIEFQTVPIDLPLRLLSSATGTRILILDACRDNPLAQMLERAGIQADTGLAKMNATRDMLIAYATQSGAQAYDGTGRNSWFTGAMLEQIEKPGLEVKDLFGRVIASVSGQTKGRQTPEMSVSLTRDFFFKRGESDVEAFGRIQDQNNPEELNRFAERFPNSPFAPLVRKMAEGIRQETRARALEARRERDAERARAQAEATRLAEAKAEAERARQDQERLALAEAERQRLAREQAERERLALLEAERKRIEAERQQRLAFEAGERERVAREQAERERAAKAEQLAKAELLAKAEQAERERVARLEAEDAARQRAEKLARERADALERERLARIEQVERERQAADEAERRRLETERQQRLAAEKTERERSAREQSERERLAKAEQAEKERVAKLEAEEAAKEAARQAAATQRAERERIARERTEAAERERLAKAEQAEKDRVAKLEAEEAAKEAARQAAATQRAERERMTRERAEAAERERLAKAEQAEKDRVAKLEAEEAAKLAAATQRAERDRTARERNEAAERERAAVAEAARQEKLAQEKLAQDKLAQDKLVQAQRADEDARRAAEERIRTASNQPTTLPSLNTDGSTATRLSPQDEAKAYSEEVRRRAQENAAATPGTRLNDLVNLVNGPPGGLRDATTGPTTGPTTRDLPSIPVTLPAVEPSDTLIRAIQAELVRIGCYQGRVSGRMDDATRASITRFQAQLGQPRGTAASAQRPPLGAARSLAEPTEALLQQLRDAKEGFCPPRTEAVTAPVTPPGNKKKVARRPVVEEEDDEPARPVRQRPARQPVVRNNPPPRPAAVTPRPVAPPTTAAQATPPRRAPSMSGINF